MKFSPMLATLTDAPFDDKEWVFEWKWDGYRVLALKEKSAHLFSRKMKLFDEHFPQILKEIKSLPGSFILDGEVAVLNESGKPDFQLLQQFQKTGKGKPCYYLFDILSFQGKDLTSLPLLGRKKILEKLLKRSKNPHLKLSRHIRGKGTLLFEKAKKIGFEGIIAKRANSPYRFVRSSDWLKIKTKKRQEFVVGGFTSPRKSRKYFGSLLVGVYERGKLRYSGHVGGGFNELLLASVFVELKKRISKHCPFENPPKPNAPVTWVKPQLVCEVAFAEWTRDGILRQPIFQGLRIDKPPQEVVRERVRVHKKSKKAFY